MCQTHRGGYPASGHGDLVSATPRSTKTRKQLLKEFGRVPMGVDGTPFCVCAGCGVGARGTAPLTTGRLQSCPRCGTMVCRVCAEDLPHRLSEGGTKICELPPGQRPVTIEDRLARPIDPELIAWMYEPTERQRRAEGHRACEGNPKGTLDDGGTI